MPLEPVSMAVGTRVREVLPSNPSRNPGEDINPCPESHKGIFKATNNYVALVHE
jgi:hypothetical protein